MARPGGASPGSSGRALDGACGPVAADPCGEERPSPAGRRVSPGRPLLWVTTPAFLVHFGLDSLKELPGLDELRATGLLDLAPIAFPETAPEQSDQPQL